MRNLINGYKCQYWYISPQILINRTINDFNSTEFSRVYYLNLHINYMILRYIENTDKVRSKNNFNASMLVTLNRRVVTDENYFLDTILFSLG